MLNLGSMQDEGIYNVCMYMRTSHREGDVAVVLSNIAFEDIGTGSHHTLETLPIQLDTAQRALRHHSGCSWTVQQQRHLTFQQRRHKLLLIQKHLVN